MDLELEALLLAFANALRPTAAAVVYALLATRRPRRSLAAYLVGGALFSVTVGFVVVVVLHGATGPDRSGTRADVVNLLAGLAAVGFAASLRRGGRPGPSTEESGRWSAWAERLADPSLAMSATAGVLTHLPGLLYLVALNTIAAQDLTVSSGAEQVLVFNAIWYSTAIVAFAAFLVRPDQTLAAVGRFRSWLGRHDREVAAWVFGLVGIYLCASGLAGLLG